MSLDLRSLIGTWELVRHGRFDAKGQYHPTGEQMTGRLLYAQDGSMSVLITKVPEPAQLSDLIAYSGTFSIEGDKVLHHVLISPYPDRVNKTGIRLASFSGKDLILGTEPDGEGRFEIVWRRVS